MENSKGGFSSKLGFVLAASGSAVGLGNIWRFPYLAAKYGGGMFLLIYIVLATTFGFTLMITEIAIGRKTGKSVVGAFSQLNKKYSFIGWISAAVPIIIFPYYCVIGGWVLKYLTVYISGRGASAAADTYFSSFTGNTISPLAFLGIFMALTAVIVLLGVEKGIEKFSKILMPILVVISLGIGIYSITLDGAMDGFIYYIKPSMEHFSIQTIVAALGQLFYSMSLAMGIMVTYGSYMKKDTNLESSVRQIEVFDTGIAFFSGMMIIPAVFAFSGGDKSALSMGPGLMFVTLPKVFQSMYGGAVIGLVFFLLVLFAALTSSVSLMETIVSFIMDKTRLTRRKACGIVIILSLILAAPSSLGFGLLSGFTILGKDILSFFDFLSNNILMPIVALLTCLFVGYVIKPKAIEDEIEQSEKFKSRKLYRVMLKYIAPVCLLVILVTSILEKNA